MSKADKNAARLLALVFTFIEFFIGYAFYKWFGILAYVISVTIMTFMDLYLLTTACILLGAKKNEVQ